METYNKNKESEVNKTCDLENSKDKTFFSDTVLFNTYQKINPVGVLEYIKSHSPITIWDLSKQLEINRNTLYYFLRDLELTGVIRTKISINNKNRAVRLVYYNKIGDKNGSK